VVSRLFKLNTSSTAIGRSCSSSDQRVNRPRTPWPKPCRRRMDEAIPPKLLSPSITCVPSRSTVGQLALSCAPGAFPGWPSSPSETHVAGPVTSSLGHGQCRPPRLTHGNPPFEANTVYPDHERLMPTIYGRPFLAEQGRGMIDGFDNPPRRHRLAHSIACPYYRHGLVPIERRRTCSTNSPALVEATPELLASRAYSKREFPGGAPDA